MAKKKVVEAEDGLKNAAVAVGSALGKFAAKIGLGEAATPPAQTPEKRKPLSRKSVVPKKKAATKKVTAKRAIVKKATRPAKKS
jgi:hypothetical protein